MCRLCWVGRLPEWFGPAVLGAFGVARGILETVVSRVPSNLVCVAAALTAAVCNAQISVPVTISDGQANFRLNPYSGGVIGSGPTAVLTGDGASGASFINQAYWWARVDNSDVREFAVIQSAPVISTPSPNQMEIRFDNAFNRPWQITIQFTIRSLGGNAAELTQRITFRNMGGPAVRNISLFNLNGVTLPGGADNDFATQTGPSEIDFVDGENSLYHGFYRADGAGAISVGSNIRDLLTNGVTDDLLPGVIESGPNRLEVGSQWSFDLLAGETRSFETVFIAIPAPGAAVLFAAAAMGIIGNRRRRTPLSVR